MKSEVGVRNKKGGGGKVASELRELQDDIKEIRIKVLRELGLNNGKRISDFSKEIDSLRVKHILGNPFDKIKGKIISNFENWVNKKWKKSWQLNVHAV